tara:strand:+ start:755 stop:949 length:195 start_codon:yes stop_codon:yes gene_type:complete
MSIAQKQEERKQTKAKLEKQKQYTELTKEELKYLIQLIGRSEFTGKDLQTLYSITAKLQNQLTK